MHVPQHIDFAGPHQIPHEYVVCISAVAWLVLDCLVSPASWVSKGIFARKCLLLQAGTLHV